MKYHKLVRDKIPDIILAKGEKATFHLADDAEYWTKLKEKLVEEAKEFCEAESPEEFADLMEVIEAIAAHKGFDAEAVGKIQDEKAEKRGRFEKRIILEES